MEEKKMNKRLALFPTALILVFLFSLVLSGPAAAQKKPVVLRLTIATPPGDFPQTFRDEEMAKRFNERAKGEYVIEVHPGMALAKLPEFMDAVRVGAVEMQFSNWGMFQGMDPRLGLLETPFLWASERACTEGVRQMAPLFDKIMQEKFNAKVLGMMSTGGLGVWSQKPVKTLGDLKGMLMASVSPSTSAMLKTLGAAPVTIMFPDIYESLSKKIVNGSAQSAHGGNVFQFFDSCKYFTAVYMMAAPAGHTINLDVWKKMPPHIQKILLEEVAKAGDFMADVMANKLPDMDLKTFKEKGVSVYYLPAEERAKWASLFTQSNEAKCKEFGELGQQFKKIVDEMNKKYPYKADKAQL
jgi:TRAP-type C4-dicarboxylate transport system substrate-binding protein